MRISICKPRSVLQWLRIYRLYHSAFPAAERKPFATILKMYRKRKTDVWCIEKDGGFVGLAATINSEALILLDYFAVEKVHRGEGIGSRALEELLENYGGKGFFVEIENTCEDSPDRNERLKRKRFYRAVGLEPLNVMVRLFGVKMELLGRDCRMDFGRYKAFYRENYSPWAANHIEEEHHPEAAK